jgi:DNA-binding LytR/AlgR family response regulator
VAINKVKLAQGARTELQEGKPGKDHLFVTSQKMKVKILHADIIYIESQKEYIRIVTTKKEYYSKMSTHEIEAVLPPQLFKRIHRSFIISVSKIESYNAEQVEVNGISIPVGRAYKDVLDTL